jgi:hypothetical protein
VPKGHQAGRAFPQVRAVSRRQDPGVGVPHRQKFLVLVGHVWGTKFRLVAAGLIGLLGTRRGRGQTPALHRRTLWAVSRTLAMTVDRTRSWQVRRGSPGLGGDLESPVSAVENWVETHGTVVPTSKCSGGVSGTLYEVNRQR